MEPIKKPLWLRLWQLVNGLTGHRIITSRCGAYDLGVYAAGWRLRWRFLTVTHELYDGTIGPAKTYFLAGDLKALWSEFIESTGK